MNDSAPNSKPTEKISQSQSTEQPLDDLDKAVIEASARYGQNTDLFLKENPQFDRRIDRTYTPKP